MLAPPRPTSPLAPSVRAPTPFVGREPKLRPCPEPHVAPSSAFFAPVSVALALPLLWDEEPVARPPSELPAPTKEDGG